MHSLRTILRYTLARTRADLNFAEEERYFASRRIGRVGAVHDVLVDALGQVGADRAGCGLFWIRGTHDVAILRDRTLALEHLDDDRSRSHEAHEVLEERPFPMYAVKRFGLGLREVQHARRDDTQSRFLEPRVNLADQIPRNAVGLDDGKGALNCHDDLGDL